MPAPESDGAEGFRLPAEWAPHRATWLSWPHNRETWPGVFDRVLPAWACMARHLLRGEEVRVLVRDEEEERTVRRLVGEESGDGLVVARVPTNDAWVRDYGPLWTLGGGSRRRATLWRFNSWGGKYPPWDLDGAAGRRIVAWRNTQSPLDDVLVEDMVLEGGSIDTNGKGTLLTTESCLLHPNRNPSLDREAIETRLRSALGVTKVLWLGEGIVGDDTDGHVDDVARFVSEGAIVAAVESDPRDPNYRPLEENLERLRGMTDQDGHSIEVVELPMPEPVIRGGERLPASYANFYIANSCVLVPTYGSRYDQEAVGILSELFPSRRVVAVHASDIVVGLGAIHCVTLQEPARKP